MNELVKVDNDLVLERLNFAKSALMEAKTIQETKKILDIATAAEILARRQKMGDEAVKYATEIKIEALCQLGAMLKDMEKNTGAAGIGTSAVPTENRTPTLADLGLDKKISKLAQDISNLSPEKLEEVKNGLISLSKISLEKKVNHETNMVINSEPPILPKGKYSIIYADPPWQYYEGGFKNQSQHYPTLTIDQVADYRDKNGRMITDLPADNCILFLWATFPILPEAINLIGQWGFNYSTVGFTWVKANKNGSGFFFGLGNWTRSNAEICLIGTRGSISRKDASISQIIYEPIGKHSAKPPIVKDKIVQLVGDLPRIELFARQKTEGWDVWGNQV